MANDTPSRKRKREPLKPVKPGTRRAKATETHSGGHPGFVPTAAEREFVRVMSGLKMTSQEICRVLGVGRGDPTNNKTGKPIAKTTLWRHFRNELVSGHSLLRAEIAGRWRAALNNGERWAIEAGLRNKFGWDPGRYGGLIGPPDDGDVQPTIAVEFVVPGYGASGREEERPGLPSPQRALPAPMFKDVDGTWKPMPDE